MTEGLDWILELHDEQETSLHRLAVMLGAGETAGDVVRSAFLMLHARERRLPDPMERVEFLQEEVVHQVRALNRPLAIPDPAEDRHTELLQVLRSMPRHMGEILVVSHFLATFGPELAGVMRMTVRGSNQRLEVSLETLRARLRRDVLLEALSQELSDALRAASHQIRVPPGEALDEVLGRAVAKPRGVVRGQLVVVASLVALALGTGVAAVTQDRPEMPPEPPPVTLAPEPSETAPVELRAVVKQVPIYYVGRGDGQLYRELRDLPSTGSLARSGVESLMTLAARDPDYISLWEGQVREVSLHNDVLSIDLSPASYESIDPGEVGAAINQVVYTTSEMLGNPHLRVRFLSDGGAPPPGFDGVEGFSRAGLAPMPGVWISDPQNQDQVAPGVITITGTVKPGFGAPVVSINDTATESQVAHTVAQTSLTVNSEGWLVWSVSAQLNRSGTYEVVAEAVGDDGERAGENKIITVGQ